MAACHPKGETSGSERVNVTKGSEMHVLYSKADALSREVIGAAIEVHRIMGPGLIESVY